jgi:hypothetical protein
MAEDVDGADLRRALKTAFWRAGGLGVLAKSAEGRKQVMDICVAEMLGMVARNATSAQPE